MKILSIGASSSSSSINQQFADYAASQIASQQDNAEVTSYALHDLSLPIYSEDEEKQNGHPADAQRFIDAIGNHDTVIISLAEHNGSYTAAFKNLYDWASRIEQKVWQDKPMLLLSTSPGPRGGATVLAAAEATFPRMGADLKASFSLPGFYDHFSDDGISDADLSSQFSNALESLNQ
ncbi:MAG: NAD(P)H-dependent oxidoreductase [Verrucomicrobiae bacterium]|nr:NAD(P)H-dependent oxidoreductase [Verrucomicrobiae bacterium]NNJ86641.1 NAD(P)H-dependent oxidoreductase [Akkermansiaceae bacterium]